jgi:hypothetical protein
VVVPVTAGSHDVSLEAFTGGAVFVQRRAISTMFVPFGKTTLIPAGVVEIPEDQQR